MRTAAASATPLVVMLLITGCKPDYPSCDKDQDCHAKEFCVDRKCQQCRESVHCGQGEECRGGKCSAISGYCRVNVDCPGGQLCIDHICQLCTSDDHCPPSSICQGGACRSAKRCVSRFDCGDGQDCVGGLCSPTQGAVGPCKPPPLLFGFNEATLTTEATGQLAGAVECLKRHGAALNAVGHADPRGTSEYNLALSERRARAVREQLERLGIDPAKVNLLPRGSLDAKGNDEAGWANDRRVDLTWE